jgi:hypothetical protein
VFVERCFILPDFDDDHVIRMAADLSDHFDALDSGIPACIGRVLFDGGRARDRILGKNISEGNDVKGRHHFGSL